MIKIGIIISGFSNVGKSSLEGYNSIDLDTGYFKKIDGWIDIYIECMLALQEKYDYVLITTHGDLLHEMDKRKIEYTLVYPKRKLKEEYRQRAIKRGSNEEFVQGFFENWDEHINDCEKNRTKNKIILESNEYLSDIIESIK